MEEKKKEKEKLSDLEWRVLEMVARHIAQKDLRLLDSNEIGMDGLAFTNEKFIAVPRDSTFMEGEGLVYHEGNHHAANSLSIRKEDLKTICKNVNIAHAVFNAIEDHRVNLFGSDIFPGYYRSLDIVNDMAIIENVDKMKKEITEKHIDFDKPSAESINIILYLIAIAAVQKLDLLKEIGRNDDGEFVFKGRFVSKILLKTADLTKNFNPTTTIAETLAAAAEVCKEIETWFEENNEEIQPQSQESQDQGEGEGQNNGEGQQGQGKKSGDEHKEKGGGQGSQKEQEDLGSGQEGEQNNGEGQGAPNIEGIPIDQTRGVDGKTIDSNITDVPKEIKEAIDKIIEQLKEGKDIGEIVKDGEVKKAIRKAKAEMKKAHEKGKEELERLKKKVREEKENKEKDGGEIGDNCGTVKVTIMKNAMHLLRENGVSYPLEEFRQIIAEYGREINILSRRFSEVKASRTVERNTRNGIINRKALPRYIVDPSFNKPFQRKKTNKGASILILIDESGSMDGRKIRAAKSAAIILAKAIEKSKNLELAVCGFAAHGDYDEILEKRYKLFNEPLDPSRIGTIGVSGTYYDNRDGASIRKVIELFKDARRENEKVLIVISDGQPSHIPSNGSSKYSGKRAIEDTAEAVRLARSMGIHTFAISIDSDPGADEYLAPIYGKHRYFKSDPYNIVDVLMRFVTAIVNCVKR